MALPVLASPRRLSRWDPLREFDDLYERMGRLMASTFGTTETPAATAGWTPLADVTETGDAYLVDVDVPGVRREDIAVEVNGNELLVSGECRSREQDGSPRSRTRREGRFEYRTMLPADVDVEDVSADLSDGVLTVRIPKSEAAKPHRIAITER